MNNRGLEIRIQKSPNREQVGHKREEQTRIKMRRELGK